jgi:hypothetical protein
LNSLSAPSSTGSSSSNSSGLTLTLPDPFDTL